MSDMIDQSELESRAARLVEAAKKAGADACDAVALTGVSLSVDVRDGKVEETDRAEGDDVTLRVFVGKRTASVSATASGWSASRRATRPQSHPARRRHRL